MKVYFDTLGCMKNFDDTDMAKGILGRSGHEIADTPEEADVIIVNTCGFIEAAKKESIDEVFRMSEYRKQGKKLLVSGCLAQRYAEDLYKEMDEADGFLGVNDYSKLPEILDSLEEKGRFAINDEYSKENDSMLTDDADRFIPEGTYSTYLRISEGCDRNCAYCIIPKIRGPYRSKSEESIIAEAARLAEHGCRELVVIAEDTGCYGIDLYGEPRLAELLKKLCGIDGIEWIRLMYCYEDHITDELIDVIANEDKMCKYIDIPLQHASDRILKSMRRKTTLASISAKLDKLRARIPDIAIRTTFITGFPGETDEDSAILEDFVEEQQFARVGVFTFSAEEGTEAFDMPDQIPEDVKEERRDAVMLKQLEISLRHNQDMIGKVYEVMIDEIDEDGSYIGRTRYDAPDIDNSVLFTSEDDHKPGDIVDVFIEEAYDYDLQGREVRHESAK
ncbi:MAG: 30S ribosomal protein S12 methylthiotransferase RimO [Eubacterium sp.]|nr:30S ribosomal protein S12 methylthiotransferase RimO [Eubacterium sp.]